jgi:hypothetical protein
MIDIISNTNYFSVVWQYVGPLVGVGFGYLISDKVWNRQRQWEMKRDAVLEAVRALGELELAMIDVRSVYQTSSHFPNNDMKAQQKASVSGVAECDAKFYRSIFVADLCVGKEFGGTLSKYFQAVNSIVKDAHNGNPNFCTSEKLKEIADLSREVINVARKKLNIKNT